RPLDLAHHDTRPPPCCFRDPAGTRPDRAPRELQFSHLIFRTDPARPPAMTATARTVPLITTLLGALILAAVFTSAALPAVGSLLAGDREASTASGGIHTAAVDGVTTLHVDSRSSDVHVAFGDVAEAQLSVSPADSNAW